MALLAWQTLALGTMMVAAAGLLDLYELGRQIELFRMLRSCAVPCDSSTTEAIGKALRVYSKSVHPDTASGGGSICTTEEINEIRAHLRMYGASKLGYVLFKIGTPPQQVEFVTMMVRCSGR